LRRSRLLFGFIGWKQNICIDLIIEKGIYIRLTDAAAAAAPAWFAPAMAQALEPVHARISNIGRRKRNRRNRTGGGALVMPYKQVCHLHKLS
jgi:hypothetical protein